MSGQSLSEKIVELTSNVNHLKTLRDQKEQDTDIVDTVQSMEEIRGNLDENQTPLEVLIENKIKNISFHFDTVDSIPEIIQMAKDFKERYSKDENVVFEPFPKEAFGRVKNFQYFVKKCKKITDELDSNMKESWAIFVRGKIPKGLNDSLISLLNRLEAEGLKEILPKIDKERKEIENIANDLPKKKEVINYLEELVNSLEEKWEKLGIPEEIIKFLQEAHSDEGAPYDSLTSPVKEWLEVYDILKNAKIIFNQKISPI